MSSLQKSRLKQEGITHILKVNGIPSSALEKMHVKENKVVSLEDNEHYDISDSDLQECFSFIKPTNRTIIVCTAGISRSSTICIAYLMRYEGLSLEKAFA